MAWHVRASSEPAERAHVARAHRTVKLQADVYQFEIGGPQVIGSAGITGQFLGAKHLPILRHSVSTRTGSPPPLQREAFVQRYLSVDCIDPHRLGKQRIVVDERAVFRQRDHRKHHRALFVDSGKGLADLGHPIGGRCHVSHTYLAR